MLELDHNPPQYETVMDVTQEQIARVYAKAFLGAAAKSPDTARMVEELISVVQDVLEKNPKLGEIVRSGLIGSDKKEALVGRVFGGRASATVVNFLKVLSRHGRLELLRPIVRQLQKLYTQHRGLVDVELRTASPLDGGLHQEIHEHLRKMLGMEPALRITIDPSLIAGMVVRVGDRVYDGSIRTQLERARRAMMDRATESIETAPQRFMAG